MAGDEYNTLSVPVWPLKEYAQCCLKEQVNACKVIPISLDTFMNELLLRMKKQGILSSVFWNGLDTILIDVDQLLFDLNWELSKCRKFH
ncbi:DUF2750 domain-containing protein [Priestia megaterium]|nr:DUF2750 domain-containing protein [Priestia megaterium]